MRVVNLQEGFVGWELTKHPQGWGRWGGRFSVSQRLSRVGGVAIVGGGGGVSCGGTLNFLLKSNVFT